MTYLSNFPAKPTTAPQAQPKVNESGVCQEIEERKEEGTGVDTQAQLYKKCFPGAAAVTFKERFPVFADILSTYSKNLKKAPPK